MLDGREVRDKQGRQARADAGRLHAIYILSVTSVCSCCFCVILRVRLRVSFKPLRAVWGGRGPMLSPFKSRVGRKVPPRCTAVPKSDLSKNREPSGTESASALHRCPKIRYLKNQNMSGCSSFPSFESALFTIVVCWRTIVHWGSPRSL